MNIDEQHPLKWPEGFGRTLIQDRRDHRQWKKQMSVYIVTMGRCSKKTAYNTVSKLSQAGVIQNTGGRYSLKEN